jgi:hypothetical protein
MLVQRRSPDLRAYFVWGRYSSMDDDATAHDAAQKYQAPGTVHFWMPAEIAPKELAAVLKIATGHAAFDVYLLYRKNIFWESQLPPPTYWQQQMGVLQGDAFDITRLETQIQRLLQS